MLSLKRFAPMALIAGSVIPSVALAQPALTTIQDTLYRADGTRYSGTWMDALGTFNAVPYIGISMVKLGSDAVTVGAAAPEDMLSQA